ncbi:MAG: helix-turn-helix transcriptional regulator [Christensenellaceae bacterium]|nr:helix-turn-helix transcriptional regulator [Christensenellaceae bacterium]
MDLVSIGKNIKKYRLQNGLHQESLAEKAGLSANYIGMVERGERSLSLESFVIIANSLGVSADMLLFDVLDKGYAVKNSLLSEKLENLSEDDRKKIYDVIETMIAHSKHKKP